VSLFWKEAYERQFFTAKFIVLIDHCPKDLISIFSLVNLDNIEKRCNKKGKDSDTDDDELSNKRKSSSKRKEKQAEESLMDHLKKIENADTLTTKGADFSSDESVYVEQVKKIDAAPISNEALMLEANKIARENLLNSSDSDNGKINSLLVGKEFCYA